MLAVKFILSGVCALSCQDPGRILATALAVPSARPVERYCSSDPGFDANTVVESMLASIIPDCELLPDMTPVSSKSTQQPAPSPVAPRVVASNRPIRLELMTPVSGGLADSEDEILTLGMTDDRADSDTDHETADKPTGQMQMVGSDTPEPDAPIEQSDIGEMKPVEQADATASDEDSDGPVAPAVSAPRMPRARIKEFGGKGSGGMTDFGSALLAGGEPIKMQPVTSDKGEEDATTRTEQMEEVSGSPGIGVLDLSPQAPSKLLRLQLNESLVIKSRIRLDRVEVPDPTIVDVSVSSPQELTIIGKAIGSTQFTIMGEGQIQNCMVMVGPNYKPLQNLIQAVSPQSSVRVDGLNGTIVLSGRAPDADTARKIEEMAKVFQGGDVLNHIWVSGVQQTMLRVTVAEVNKEALRSLGINWAVGGSKLSRDFFLANNIGQLNPTNFGSNGLPDVTTGQMTYSVNPVGTSPLTNLTFGFPRAELQFFVNALRENSLARTLAEPTLVAISGQTASFLAGGEVPIPVTQGGAVAGAITIEYKEFGVRLAFTPTILGNQLMRLHVMSEVSDAVETSRVVGTLPLFTFTTRRVETTVECGNGQSFAIAGLLSDNVRAISSKIPGVGDIPVIGALFSSVEYRNDKTELVVLVTPELVEAIDPQQVVTPPGADMRQPDDFELFGLGLLEGRTSQTAVGETDSEEPTAGDTAATVKERSLAELPLYGPWGSEESTVEYAN